MWVVGTWQGRVPCRYPSGRLCCRYGILCQLRDWGIIRSQLPPVLVGRPKILSFLVLFLHSLEKYRALGKSPLHCHLIYGYVFCRPFQKTVLYSGRCSFIRIALQKSRASVWNLLAYVIYWNWRPNHSLNLLSNTYSVCVAL